MHNFCANVLELQVWFMNKLTKKGSSGSILAMSTKAYNSFNKEQLAIIQKHTKIVHSSISTIEVVGGGGVRCCIAELF